MQEKELKMLFEEGVLSTCTIVASPVRKGYIVLFTRKGDREPSIELETRPRRSGDETEMRVFKTVDSAFSLVVRQIGFRVFTVKDVKQ